LLESAEIRSSFLNFFAERGHKVLDSAPLLPSDPELLFNIAGMVPFKPYFLGEESPPASRVTTAQKCLRTADIENVGHTARHHTFFEMLGNFSFGDYFKSEAILYAWDFLTGEMDLKPERMWVGIFGGDPDQNLVADEEARRLWIEEAGVPEERILEFDVSENFWAMSETGPCGPCSEVHYDLESTSAAPEQARQLVKAGADRMLELWNLVFMQYNRDKSGDLTPLPRQNIDTGLGLERLAVVKQGVQTNFETDLFKPLIAEAADLAGVDADANGDEQIALRVIADHVRAAAFLLAEGLLPGNEGRGYILRRLIRRAGRWGRKINFREPFLYELISTVVAVMGEHYELLADKRKVIEKNLRREEEQFNRTLDRGLDELESRLEGVREGNKNQFSGQEIFDLYETHGLPIEMTTEVLRDEGIDYSSDEIEAAREEHRRQSRGNRETSDEAELDVAGLQATDFIGYQNFETESQVVALFKAGQQVEELSAGDEGVVILDRTPFYAEQGGQVGDRGTIGEFKVKDTRPAGDVYTHHGRAGEKISVGDQLWASIDKDRRRAVMRHHTSTHLLQAALRDELGEQVMQSGSFVGPDYFRFDFTYNQKVSAEQLERIEAKVNQMVSGEFPLQTQKMSRRQAESEGALAFFGEHYGETVRVVKIESPEGIVSKELCGGTHVANTGLIGAFVITDETSVAAGVRRIEARSGLPAYQFLAKRRRALEEVRSAAGVQREEEIIPRLQELENKISDQEKELESYRQKQASGRAEQLLSEARQFGRVSFICEKFEAADDDTLKKLLDNLREELETGVVLLINEREDSVQLLAGVTDDLTAEVKAGELVGKLGKLVGGGGGGRPDFAQAGGSDPSGIPRVVEEINALLQEKYGAPAGY